MLQKITSHQVYLPIFLTKFVSNIFVSFLRQSHPKMYPFDIMDLEVKKVGLLYCSKYDIFGEKCINIILSFKI